MMLKLLRFKNNTSVFIFAASIILPSVSLAATYKLSDNQQMQFHGFASQSYIYTDNNNFFGNSSDNGSIDFRELGLNTSLQTGKNLYFSAQVLSRRAGEFDSGNIKLDFAIADYRIKQATDYNLGIRIGRVKNPVGFYNDTRDVSFTRPSIILPQSIYFERTRDLSISSDGVQFYGYKDLGPGSTRFQFIAANPRVGGENTELAVLGENKAGKFTAEPSYLGRIIFETHNRKLKIAASEVILNMDYEPTTTETGFNGDASLKFHLSILSIQLNHKEWSLTGEYARRKIYFKNMFAGYVPSFLNNVTGESYYVQLSYRVNYHWKILTRYDVLYQNKNDRDGSLYADSFASIDMAKPAYSRFAKDMTLGIQWLINASWMLQVEIHAIDGTGWLPMQDNKNIDNAMQKWKMVGAAVSYRF